MFEIDGRWVAMIVIIEVSIRVTRSVQYCACLMMLTKIKISFSSMMIYHASIYVLVSSILLTSGLKGYSKIFHSCQTYATKLPLLLYIGKIRWNSRESPAAASAAYVKQAFSCSILTLACVYAVSWCSYRLARSWLVIGECILYIYARYYSWNAPYIVYLLRICVSRRRELLSSVTISVKPRYHAHSFMTTCSCIKPYPLIFTLYEYFLFGFL